MFESLTKLQTPAKAFAEALAACRTHFYIAAGFSALVNLLYLAPTLYMMQVYDRVVPTGGIATLLLLTGVVLMALAALAALDAIRTQVLVRAGLRLDRLLAGDVLSRIMARSGDAAAGAQPMRDFDAVKSALSGPGFIAVFDAPWSLIFLLVCFLLHPLIGLMSLGGAVVLLILAILSERESRPRLRRSIEAGNAAYQAQGTLSRQAEVVRALGMRDALVTRQLEARQEATVAQTEAQLSGGGYRGLIKFTRMFLQSLSLGLGAWLAVQGEISAGAIIAASVLLSRTVAPIEQVVGAWPNLVQALTSWRSLQTLFTDTPEPDVERTALPAPTGRLQLDKVGVRLRPTDEPQLKPLSLTVEAGEILGVIGPSGSGKTTLARVIAGALSPDLGAVRLDGADYRQWDDQRLARHIGYLPQAAVLFAGTVRDNVSRFDGGEGARADIDARVVTAAQVAGVHEMILALPGGYDAVLGPDGGGLSAGQAQRIALARALYGDPHLVVLDEPNSNLDQDGETALVRALTRVRARGGVVVVVAHRAGVLSAVDRLLVMKGGAMELLGPRDEVIARLNAAAPSPGAGPRVASV